MTFLGPSSPSAHRFPTQPATSDIEQVLKEKVPFILHCMSSDLKVMQGRSPAWNRCALNASII
jgi:hypothetical protein